MNKNSGRNWINFNELRKRLKFEDVLKVFNVEINRKGDQHVGRCPLPKHDGERGPTSFSAQLEKGIFQCFGCEAKGNVLEFAALMEGIDPKNGQALRKVAVKLQLKFFPSGLNERKDQPKKEPELPLSGELPVVVNAPLDFELKTLQHNHPIFENRRFELKTIVHFGVGVCSQGVLKGSVAIPLHSEKGELLGYAGSFLADELRSDEITRYSLPVRRERKGQIHEFDPSRFLYNGHKIKGPVDNLILVEGFASVWWLHQNGFANSVSTMGPNLSDTQLVQVLDLLEETGTLWIVPIKDSEGSSFAVSVFLKVAPHRKVRWAKLERGEQAIELSRNELDALILV